MRKIESVDFFYLAMPEILDVADGSQDAMLVRIVAGDQIGWGECEASPLVTIASMICPMSHSACKPVAISVLGEVIDSAEDIYRIHRKVRQNSADLLQADHALSGIDIALWDLLGKIHQVPVYHLLDYQRTFPKLPYYSLLFGNTPQETFAKAQQALQRGFRAVKFGWGPFGILDIKDDIEQIVAAREGIGKDAILCIDAGTVWGNNLEMASKRLKILQENNVTWLEEPFYTYAFKEYYQLSGRSGSVKLAGGEGAHNEYMAQHMIDYTGISYIQVDPGRVGGITSAKRVFDYAHQKNVNFINHTFTSHLALSASLQSFSGSNSHYLCEYPGQPSPLGYELTIEHLMPDENGEISLPESPGLGITPNVTAIQKYLVDAQIVVNGHKLYKPPSLYL